MKKNNILRLTEIAMMVALATVLSIVKLFEMPYGGSITAFSMVPIAIVAMRYGNVWGLSAGFAYSLIQLLLGQKNLSYATSASAAVTIIMFDYVIAFTVIGLAGLFRNKIKSQSIAASVGMVMVCAMRFLCHFWSGCTVWAGISIPTKQALIYSVGYNASYMIPETIINTIVIFWICGCLEFREDKIKRIAGEKRSPITALFAALSILAISAAVVVDAIIFFAALQREDGTLSFSRLGSANYTLIGIIAAIGLVLCLIFAGVAQYTVKKKNN